MLLSPTQGSSLSGSQEDPRGESSTFMKRGIRKLRRKWEGMAKTRETPKALSCRNSHQPNKLQVITEALLVPFYSVFPLTVIYFTYNRPHSR